MTNSIRKGKAGERAAAKYLESIGFVGARRTQQHCGDAGDSDVLCVDSLPGVFIEVKYGYKRNGGQLLGGDVWRDAIAQARANCPAHQRWCILFKPHGGRMWFLTFECISMVVTVTHEDIHFALNRLNESEP